MMSLKKTLLAILLVVKTVTIYCADIALMVNVPMANNLFVGRDSYLSDIHSHLLKNNMMMLNGAGGIGKTQIAKQYTYAHQNAYDIVWWVKAKEDLAFQIQQIVGQWNNLVPNERKVIYSKQIEIDLNHLQKAIGQEKIKWLIIFDDYYNKSHEALDKFIAQVSKMSQVNLIITNRDGMPIAGNYRMKINQFTRKESLDYLAQFSNPENKNDHDSHQILAEMFDDYPLSIACAFAYIETLPITVKEYISLYKSHIVDITKIESDVVTRLGKRYTDSYGMTLQTTINISLDKISKAHPLAIDILKLITLIDNKNIPEDLILQYLNIDKVKYTEAINVLMAYSLIDYTDGKDSFKCHDEIHKALYFYFNESELKDILPKLIVDLNSLIPDDVLLVNQFIASHPSFIQHIERIYQHAQNFDIVSNELIRLKTKQLEFILTNQRDKNLSGIVVNEIAQLINKSKNTVNALVQVRFLLMQSTYTDWMLADYNRSTQQAKEAEQLIERNKSAFANREKLMLAARLSQVYVYQGDYKQALNYVARGEKIIAEDKTVNIGFQCVLVASKSIAYYHQGDFTKAADIEKQASLSAKNNLNKDMSYQKGNVFGIPLLLDKNRMMIKAKDSLNEVLAELNQMELDILEFYGEKKLFFK
ncbi:NB-ARC domain-containing protein [Cysteiniphilum litorale]|uniref:NB-ARC domain-containing protein n=1 Tax=Cysteiniphilum litorale TaxID=2056700 RepID=UPI003F883BDF